jgi:hypothetical protein
MSITASYTRRRGRASRRSPVSLESDASCFCFEEEGNEQSNRSSKIISITLLVSLAIRVEVRVVPLSVGPLVREAELMFSVVAWNRDSKAHAVTP